MNIKLTGNVSKMKIEKKRYSFYPEEPKFWVKVPLITVFER